MPVVSPLVEKICFPEQHAQLFEPLTSEQAFDFDTEALWYQAAGTPKPKDK